MVNPSHKRTCRGKAGHPVERLLFGMTYVR